MTKTLIGGVTRRADRAAAAGWVAGSGIAAAAEAQLMVKSAVNYRPAKSADESCRRCLFYRGDSGPFGRCSMVAGEIAEGGWCAIHASRP